MKANAVAKDNKANIEISGGESLVAGQDNPLKVTCIAENGDKQEYIIVVKRAPSHDETTAPAETEPPETEPPLTTTQTEPPKTEPPQTTPMTEVTTETIMSTPDSDIDDDATPTKGVSGWIIALIALLCLGVGFSVGHFGELLWKRKK